MRSTVAVILFVALVVGFAPSAFARRIETWSYDDLFKAADLVVITTAKGSKDNNEKVNLGWKTEFIGVNTTFEVKSTLKGKAPEKLTVLHFRAPEGQEFADGPLLVTFRDKRANLELKKVQMSLGVPDYMLFLKASKDAKDARYEPVSGRVDPELSVFVLTSPSTDNYLANDKK